MTPVDKQNPHIHADLDDNATSMALGIIGAIASCVTSLFLILAATNVISLGPPLFPNSPAFYGCIITGSAFLAASLAASIFGGYNLYKTCRLEALIQRAEDSEKLTCGT